MTYFAWCGLAGAQHAVPGGAFFRGVDAFAGEQVVDLILQSALARQLQQQFQGFRDDQVF